MNFTQLFSSGRPILSFEFFPPRTVEQLDATKAQIAELKAFHPDFMTVTYGAGGGARELTRDLVRFIHADLETPAMAHLTCVGHSAAEIDAVLDSLAEAGISNILALRGDPPKGEDTFVAHPDGFSCARDLAAHIARRGQFHIAVAGYPEVHPEADSAEKDLLYLKEKVEAGGEIIVTQLFFEPALYSSFLERARSVGITAPIVPGIMPISNFSQLKRFTSMCGASIPESLYQQLEKLEQNGESIVDFGIAHATELCEALLDLGAPGLHFYTLNKSVQVGPIVEALTPRLRGGAAKTSFG